MKNTAALLDGDRKQSAALCKLLKDNGWKCKAFDRYRDLAMDAQKSDYRIIVINLDNINIDAIRIEKLRLNNKHSHIIALSSQSYHPDLEAAFRAHISVCIANPVDSDELLYWLTTFEP